MKNPIFNQRKETSQVSENRQKELLYMGQYMAMLAKKEKLAALKMTG